MITQQGIMRKIIDQKGCHNISCDGEELTDGPAWNQGVQCPLFFCHCNYLLNVSMARDWLVERGLPLYSTTFEIEHRFKPGDRVMNKHAIGWLQSGIITVAEVVFGVDCGAFYRFAEEGIPTGSISYCDENMRLADYDEEDGQAEEVKYYTRDCRDCEKGTGYSDVCFTCQTTATGRETD